MTAPTIGIVVAYVLIAVLLLSMNLTSRWMWWVKAGTIVVTTAFFLQSFISIVGVIGWPSTAGLPPIFKLHWATIVEPNQFMGEEGAIYLWVEKLDENNVPVGVPRSFELPYTDELAEKVDQATRNIQDGIEQSGTALSLEKLAGRELTEEELDGELAQIAGGEPEARIDPNAYVPDETLVIEFDTMPVLDMPLKTEPL